ncbi:MAG: DUF4956 domain-containing protein [Clostridia bacterium]|nr:DUF4956 domain-containing protein [Clostridia bacterium]
MSFLDMIKNSVISQFNTGVSMEQMLFSLLSAFLMTLFILFIYHRTFRGVLFSKGFAFSLILLGMITAVVIRTISSNLALSLGMVGALSIVRFRTAVKDPVDTIFMFWAIAAGIMSGAGLYLPGTIACLVVGVLYYVVCLFSQKTKSPYLLIVRYDPAANAALKKTLRTLPKYRVKSRTLTRNGAELTVELTLKTDEMGLIDAVLATEGVTDASLVSYEGEFGL